MKQVIDDKFELLINPFPILPQHFTIPLRQHQPQQIRKNYTELHRLLSIFPDLMFFYNGPKCGASAPDHMHFQGEYQYLAFNAQLGSVSAIVETTDSAKRRGIPIAH